MQLMHSWGIRRLEIEVHLQTIGHRSLNLISRLVDLLTQFMLLLKIDHSCGLRHGDSIPKPTFCDFPSLGSDPKDFQRHFCGLPDYHDRDL